jgi:hypothetical protein
MATFIKVESSAMMNEDKATSISAIQPILLELISFSKNIPPRHIKSILEVSII